MADNAQLKKFGIVLLALGVVMAGVSLWTDTKWQLYVGGGAAALGLLIAIVAVVKK